MLINVFGIWLVAANITYLHPDGDTCEVYLAAGSELISAAYVEIEQSCDSVAEEINRQAKGLIHD